MSNEKPNAIDSGGEERDLSFSTEHSPLENKSIVNLIERFSYLFADRLSLFLNKKMDVEFDSMQSIQTEEKIHQDTHSVVSSFSINKQSDYGLIFLDASLLDLSINFLFGHVDMDEHKPAFAFGKFSLKIAQEISTRSVEILQEIMPDYIAFNPTLLKTTDQLKNVNHHSMSENAYEFVFKIKEKKSCHFFMFMLPEKIVEEIIFQNKKNEVSMETPPALNEQLKNDVIDTTVDIVAVLPDIKLKFSDVMNLKSGDLIPIYDPKEIELRVGNKKLFKGTAGQANSFKVVKMGEPINKT